MLLLDPHDKPSAEWIEWEASLTPALLEGLAPVPVHVLASQGLPSWNQISAFLAAMRTLRDSGTWAA